MSEVQVTNHTASALRGRFAGENYVFAPEEPTAISRQAAVHIFGLGQTDKTRALNNLGILTGEVTYKQALEVLAKISFVEGHMVYEAQQQGPGGGQQTPPPKPGEQHPGQQAPGQKQPGQQPPATPGKEHEEKRGPAKDEDDDETQESGGRPGAHRSPGRKSEGEGSQHTSPSDDPEPAKRKW